ncbi:hypothetical protein FM115_04175 [Marinilactibacillus psychrotolerans 42ea]|uniref:UDP-N-acetylglucosamine kinase n=1 Tax=Marinilactibacillus psychrotolerans 42ea TaxID=1255609 RepID=A0A1R4J7A1_9LACT|nr:hypothetical protein FM115_04175 [Marinilactibacillus psychrotolerans 42ea]
MTKLIIIRGNSGSGKTTLARNLQLLLTWEECNVSVSRYD